MDEVLHGVGGVNELIGQIAMASEEQSKGIAQVTLAVAELDRVTQQNAALVQQVSATTNSLSGQTAALGDVITRFTLPQAAQAEGVAAVNPAAQPPRNMRAAPAKQGGWVAFGRH